jgi:hypothetical protein
MRFWSMPAAISIHFPNLIAPSTTTLWTLSSGLELQDFAYRSSQVNSTIEPNFEVRRQALAARRGSTGAHKGLRSG